MSLNEGSKDRHPLTEPWKGLSYSKHAPPHGLEKGHTQERSHAVWLIDSHGPAPLRCRSPRSLRAACRKEPRSRDGSNPLNPQQSWGARTRSQAPAQPRACPLTTTVPEGIPAALGGPAAPKPQGDSHAPRSPVRWPRPAAATGCAAGMPRSCAHTIAAGTRCVGPASAASWTPRLPWFSAPSEVSYLEAHTQPDQGRADHARGDTRTDSPAPLTHVPGKATFAEGPRCSSQSTRH